jgi:histidine triad (HIT) family protein
MQDSNCIFCKIIEGKIPSKKVFENDVVIGFEDLAPQAAKHLLFIHKSHTTDVGQMMLSGPKQVEEIFLAITHYTRDTGLDRSGFRVVTNQGKNAGQTVFHSHFHLLGGEPLGHFGR